jgi:signal transduction histidine kinase/DNA-binding response OmpR family regulator
MAVENDRRAVARGPAQDRLPLSWLSLIGLGLFIALLAAAFVQARQYTLLRQALQSGDDYSVLMVYQAESEYLRLREQWRQAADERVPFDADRLRLRYEIWVSRVELLSAERPRRLIAGHPESAATLGALQGFIAAADAALGQGAQRPPDRAFAQRLWPQFEALGRPMHTLSLAGAHRVAENNEGRGAAVRQQNQLSLGLTLFLSVLTLAFALVALRHMRQLRERRSVLEELATSLREARRDAEAASEAKSVFLANISHEIRTPFHGLMGMLSLLRETGLTAKQIDYLRTATESADHLLAILNDILDMSQLESGRMALAPAPLELRTLLRDVEALMRPQATAKQLALHLDADPGVPERIVADGTRVKQVLFNLLSNAIKFSEQGAVVLDVRTQGDAQGAPLLEFVVTDTGIGMDEATLARLFKRFVQGDNSRSRRFAGTGLGLEISRNLARLMGGDISVRSRLGEGSSFTFTLPLKAAGPAGSASADAPAAGGGAARSLDVLVAEDHPVNRQYMAALLENLGHRAHFTTNGEEAVQAARERRFDIVLMDLHMPVLDGVAATRAIRMLPERAAATVPIVALTADAFPETRERCLVAGMNDFLTKPVSPQKLASALRRLFGAGAAATAAAETAPPAPPARAEAAQLIDENALRLALEAIPRDRLAAMIEAFLAQGAVTVQRLHTAVRDAQPLELRVNAHAAKGAALNLGLSALAATAEALQQGAAHLPAHEIARLVQRYEELLPHTRAALVAMGVLGAPAAATAPAA